MVEMSETLLEIVVPTSSYRMGVKVSRVSDPDPAESKLRNRIRIQPIKIEK